MRQEAGTGHAYTLILITNSNSKHDEHVSKDRPVMADGTRISVSYWLELGSRRAQGKANYVNIQLQSAKSCL